MLTRCPNCHTIFRIREDQLKMADGLAHCYRCEQVFNAHENLTETPMAARSPSQGSTPSSATFEGAHTADTIQSTQVESAIAGIQREITPAPLAQDSAPSRPDIPPLSIDELLAPPKKSKGFFATLFWLLACTALLAAATLQLAWFEREEVIKYPEGRMLLEKLCHYAKCQLPEQRDLTLIKITQRQITSHPEQRNALLVELTIQNQAPFSQPYPILELSLSTTDGTLIARRSFSPTEYLDPATASNRLMPPDISRQIKIEIEDPGTDVTGFEFDFF
ncbi:MAG: zinc-ribbon and DUF3426 domain-containing protein [Candidatus Polarisedimenticolaceae bacterium]|nr:zinc-ribbon and DUF3426 domain-containing protein [Candidatus Polarisedimenticolaceae bacterium]